MDVQCTWASRKDLPELEGFIFHHYGQESVQAQKGRFRWLFADNPAGMHVLTGRLNGKLVAVCGHLPVTLNLNNKTIIAAYGVDFFVDPEHRRKGIGRLFIKERLQRFEVSLSSGQSPAMANLYKGENVAVLGQFQRGLFVRRPNFFGPPKAILRESFAWGLGQFRGSSGRRTALSLDSAVAWLKEDKFSKAKANFFSWRFSGPVYRNYQFHLLETQDQSNVLVTRQEPEKEIIVALFGDNEHRAAFLGCAARTSSAQSIGLECAGKSLVLGLKKQGFLVRPSDALIVAMSRESSMLQALENTDWASFAADSDSDLLRLENNNHA